MNNTTFKTRFIAVTTTVALLGFSSLGAAEDLEKERVAFLGGSVVTGGLVAAPPEPQLASLWAPYLGKKPRTSTIWKPRR
jgi:hypothetical protein